MRSGPLSARRGFTLSEILVSLAITGLTVALLLPFFVFNLRSIFHGEQKLLINGDIRGLTNAMMENARESNYFLLYNGFYTFNYIRDLNGDGARDQTDVNAGGGVSNTRNANGDGVVNELDRQLAGDAGDFLVLVFTQNNAIYDTRYYDNIVGNEPANETKVVRIIGYWVAPNRIPPQPGESRDRYALYVFDTDKSKSSASATSWTTSWGASFPVTLNAVTTLESLLPPATQAGAVDAAYAEVLINDLDGRAPGGKNFLNFGNRTAVVQTRVLHGNRAKRVTNTYNFAITPRG